MSKAHQKVGFILEEDKKEHSSVMNSSSSIKSESIDSLAEIGVFENE